MQEFPTHDGFDRFYCGLRYLSYAVVAAGISSAIALAVWLI